MNKKFTKLASIIMAVLFLFSQYIFSSAAEEQESGVTTQVPQSDNLLPDPGFELGTWSITGIGGSIDSSVKHSGTQSARINGGSTESYFQSKLIPVTYSSSYELSAWVKTSGISTVDGANMTVLMVDSSYRSLGWTTPMFPIKTGGTQDWTQYKANIRNLNANTAYVKVYCRVNKNVSGTAWFDDI